MTILLIAVCFFIPVVGPIVMIGYLFKRFVNVRAGIPDFDFDFNDFVDYLKVGLWPFLVSLVFSLIYTPLFFLCFLPMLGVAADPENESLILIVIGGCFLLMFAMTILCSILTWPMMLRSAVTMNFAQGFKFSWHFNFIKKVGIQIILWNFVVLLVSIPLSMLGSLAFFVGVYFTSAMLLFVMYHLLFQIYDRYLELGGEAIPVNPNMIKEPKEALPPPPHVIENT